MPASLKQILLAPQRRPSVVADLHALADREVAGKSGMSGFAVKAGYAVVTKVRSGFVPHAINQMLPEFAHRLQPIYERYDPEHDGTLSDFLVAHDSAVADIMLAVADRRARDSKRETARRAYQKLRPQAKRHVEHALPGIGVVIAKYAEAARDEPVEPADPQDAEEPGTEQPPAAS